MKILNKKILFKTKFLSLFETVYLNTKKEKSKWYHAERPNNQKGVMISAFVGNKLVVIKEFRLPIEDYEWNLPAGLIDKDESIEIAARREFNEETGLEITEINKISPFVYNTAGLTNESISIVFAEAKGKVDYSKNEASEDIEVFIMSKSEIKNLLETPDIKISAKAWLIFNYFVSEKNNFY